MAESSPSWTAERARLASLSRSRPKDDPQIVAARQNLKELRLAQEVTAVVESWPPLRREQLDRLATLLTPAVKR